MSRGGACSHVSRGSEDCLHQLTGWQRLGLNHAVMKRAIAQRIEIFADACASVSLGGAAGILVYRLVEPVADGAMLGAWTGVAAVIAWGLSRWVLGLIEPGSRKYPAAGGIVPAERQSGTVSASAKLVVVQLFDPPADRVPSQATRPSRGAPPDSSQALHEALNQLRQSLANRR